LFCDGATLKLNEYYSLFAVLRETFGAATTTDFSLPDFRPLEKDLKGARYIISSDGAFPSREVYSTSVVKRKEQESH
jgi:microcystin-dependent protein